MYVLVEPRPTERPVVDPDPGLLVLDPRWAAGQLGVDDHGRAVDLTRRGPIAADELTPDQLTALRAGTHHPIRTAAGGWTVERTDTPKWSREAGTQNARERTCSRCHRPATGPLRGRNNATSWQHPPDRASPIGAERPEPTPTVPPPTSPCRCRRPWPTTTPASTGRDRLRLVDQLRTTAPALTRVGSTRQLRHLLRPWLDTAWTINDVLTALDQHPVTGSRPHAPLTDTPTTSPGAIRNPTGWLLARLRDWTHPHGTPLPSHATRTAAHRATRDNALRAARATTAAQQANATTTPPPAWTTARAQLQHNAARRRR